MVNTFGNNIVSAFTNGTSVKAIYTYGEKVWPTEPEPPTGYYISWLPTTLSGSFSIGGTTYRLEDYGGYFSGFNGVITKNAFESTGITRVETNAYSLGRMAFAYCNSLKSAYLLECGTLNNAATFFYCSSLTTVSLPVCSRINTQTFQGCCSLKTVYAPELLNVGESAFKECPSLSVISLPKCSILGSGAFLYTGNTHKTLSIYAPVCNRYEKHCFGGRTLKISGLDFTSCSYIGSYAFDGAIGYTTSTLSLPNCSYIGSYAFIDCGFTEIRLSNVSYIGDHAFNYNNDLWESQFVRKVYIYTSFVCTLVGSYTFKKLHNQSWYPGAYIYVPASLVSEYKNAPVWSYYSNYIYSIK